jgi:signal transduction histidine kinase
VEVAVVANEVLPTIVGETVVEVRDRGELLGALSVAMPPSDPMNPSKERLVRDLASQAGLVLRNVRLVEELRASHRRLVTAQDRERRRLERNIHDGSQQQLVALSVKTRLARDLTRAIPPGRPRCSRRSTPRSRRPWMTCATWRAASTRRS